MRETEDIVAGIPRVPDDSSRITLRAKKNFRRGGSYPPPEVRHGYRAVDRGACFVRFQSVTDGLTITLPL